MKKIQNIIFPKPGICSVQEMYYRLASIPGSEESPYRYDSVEQRLFIEHGGIVFFDTYFNGLSIGKWMKYTTVTKFALSLEFQGSFAVSLLHSKYINGVVVQKVLAAEIIEAKERQTVDIPFPQCETVGAISFRLDSLADGGILFGGGYFAAECEDKPRDIGLAINICNYQREEYIYRNMGIIQKFILDNPSSELRHHLSIFVVDNSQTVDMNRLPTHCSNVYPQGDFGGSGGFTRGLMEILRTRESRGLTHVVMLDDDILLEPDNLERLYAFLSFMRLEYQKAFVGGALLRMDNQNVQWCRGGEWGKDNYYSFSKIGSNLIQLRDVLLNEIEDGTAKINGWWFHCIPLSEISLGNLPYPFFFHMDDVEYDLRICKQVIHLNGICVWHEPFEDKPSSHLSYYNTRNIMICNTLRSTEWNCREAKLYLTKEFFSKVCIYRYREAALVLRGVEDAMRGPTWLVAQNPETLLENVLAQGYKKHEMAALPIRFDYGKYLEKYGEAVLNRPEETKWHRFWRHFSLNGYLCKTKSDVIVPMYFFKNRSERLVYRAKRVLNYDPVSNRGFITEKSYKELFRLLWRYLKVRRLLNRRFKKVRQEYLDAFPSMTNSTFWYQYLGVTQESEDGVGV